MAGETKALAEFATALRYEDIPASVIAITKACLLDTVAVALFGSSLPWSKSVEDFARHVGGSGASTILSPSFRGVSAPAAALANGTFAHAFEFDNLRQPSIGVHPGSTASVATLAAAQERGASGRELLTALVALLPPERIGGPPSVFATFLTGNIAKMKIAAQAADLKPQ